MLARRRNRPGVKLLREPGGSRLLFLRRRLGRWREALALFRGKRLVLRPLRAEVRTLVGGRLGDALVRLPSHPALLWSEARPVLHALLYALLLRRSQLRIALGDADPLALAHAVQAVPVGLQRREHLLLLGGQLRPGRPRSARRTPGRGTFRRRCRGFRRSGGWCRWARGGLGRHGTGQAER